MNGKKTKKVLKENTLEIYLFMLKKHKALGIREIQKELNLSSPSLAQYHLSKLESAGYVKKTFGKIVSIEYS